MAAAILYGDEEIVVSVASNGPDGIAMTGGGPPKLIYLEIWIFHLSK
jgi:hypothetical protein